MPSVLVFPTTEGLVFRMSGAVVAVTRCCRPPALLARLVSRKEYCVSGSKPVISFWVCFPSTSTDRPFPYRIWTRGRSHSLSWFAYVSVKQCSTYCKFSSIAQHLYLVQKKELGVYSTEDIIFQFPLFYWYIWLYFLLYFFFSGFLPVVLLICSCCGLVLMQTKHLVYLFYIKHLSALKGALQHVPARLY